MDADGFCSLPIGLWGLVITLRLLTRASMPPMRAASCAAATRSASLPTSPKRVIMPLLARTWTCVLLQPPIGTNPVLYFRNDLCSVSGNEIGFAAVSGMERIWFHDSLLEPESSTLAGSRSATTVGSTAFAAASDSVAFVPWKGVCRWGTSEDSANPAGAGERR